MGKKVAGERLVMWRSFVLFKKGTIAYGLNVPNELINK